MRQFDDNQITMTKYRLQTGLNLVNMFPNRGQTQKGWDILLHKQEYLVSKSWKAVRFDHQEFILSFILTFFNRSQPLEASFA